MLLCYVVDSQKEMELGLTNSNIGTVKIAAKTHCVRMMNESFCNRSVLISVTSPKVPL